MRIAHVLRRLSFDDWGGTEQVVWNLAKAQKAAGHEVRLFATTALWKPLAAENAKIAKTSLCPLCSLWLKNEPYAETVEGIEIVRFKPIYPWWPMPKSLIDDLDRKGGNPFVPGLGRALREWKPDVIHCHAMARIAELCLRVGNGERGTGNGERGTGNREQETGSSKLTTNDYRLTTIDYRLTTKTVISLHGGGANVPGAEAASLRAPTRGRLPWGKAIDMLMGWIRRVPEDFDGIVCVGEDEYEKYKAVHPHVMYLPNGVDTKLFDCSPNSQLTPTRSTRSTRLNSQPPTNDYRLTTNDSQLTLLCVARIDRQKNQMALVEWLARHPCGSVRLVGPVTQPDYRAELESRAAALGVAGRLSFAGALKPGSPELAAEYGNADVFVLPSRHEPFGIVVLEAWAAGLPVAASDVGGLGRLCAAHPGAAKVFAPGDAAALDAAVDAAAEKSSEMSECGRAAAQEYDWSRLSSRLVDFYAEI